MKPLSITEITGKHVGQATVLTISLLLSLSTPSFGQGPIELLTEGRPNIVGYVNGKTTTIPILTDIERLAYVSVLIQTNRGAAGTGFFVRFGTEDGGYVPALITNNHVVDGANEATFELTVVNQIGEMKPCIVKLASPGGLWFLPHPNPDIDLCYCPIAPVLNDLEAKNYSCFNPFIPVQQMCADKNKLGRHQQLDEVFMVGCPAGIWDEINRNAIFRRGILASNPGLNYKGKSIFLADIPTWPGSSGSPLFSIRQGLATDKFSTAVSLVPRVDIELLGIAVETHTNTVRGDVIPIPIPESWETPDEKAMVPVPNGLGLFIKSEQLLELDRHITELLKSLKAEVSRLQREIQTASDALSVATEERPVEE